MNSLYQSRKDYYKLQSKYAYGQLASNVERFKIVMITKVTYGPRYRVRLRGYDSYESSKIRPENVLLRRLFVDLSATSWCQSRTELIDSS
jgi:hypothetical protein